MTQLVPKAIIDRNGVATTRMVRPESGDAASRRLPVPVIPARSTEQAGDKIMPLLQSVCRRSGLFGDEDTAYIEENLAELPAATQTMIADTLVSETDDFLACVVASSLHSDYPWPVVDDMVHLYRSLDADARREMRDYGVWTDVGFDSAETMSRFFVGLETLDLPGLPYSYGTTRTPLRAREPETTAKVAALWSLTEMLINDEWNDEVEHWHNGTMISRRELAQLAADRPGQVHEIIGVIRDRSSIDPELITALLDSAAPAVREGLL